MNLHETRAWWADLPCEDDRERSWERQMHFAGVERFAQRQASIESKKHGSELAAGQKLIRTMLPAASAAISTMQREVIALNRVDRQHKATVLLVPSDTTALISLRCMIDRCYAVEDADGASYQHVATAVGKVIEGELNFRNWIQTSKEAAKAYAVAHGYERTPTSIAEKLLKEEGADPRSIRRWKRNFDALNQYEWDKLETHYCGDALVNCVAEAFPDKFVVKIILRRGKRLKTVGLTPEFRHDIERGQIKVASYQVNKKPMISPPMRWEEVE